jgi:hypothetical protein
VHRSRIDANSIQGFVLASSDDLVVLQYVYDFNLDGLMVIRTADITEVRCTATDKFQKRLLEQEGLIKRVPFGIDLKLNNWRSVISELSEKYALMILECEAGEEKEFVIGRVLDTTTIAVQVRYFSGAAAWSRTAVKLNFIDITSCRVGTKYIDVYERYFAGKGVARSLESTLSRRLCG